MSPNLEKLLPTLVGAGCPSGSAVRMGCQTLTTTVGDIDFLGEVAGGDTYSDLLAHSFEVEAFGVRFKCLDLPTLIRIKEAAGRPKDREAIAELRVLLEEMEKKQT